MVEAADAKNFHPRLTNLGTCDFGVALALPEIPATELIGVDKRREPKVHESLLERLSNILQRTDVSYLSSTLQLTTKPPGKSGLRDGLTLKCPDIFDVTSHRPSRKANPPRQQVGSKVTTITRDSQKLNQTKTIKVSNPLRRGGARSIEMPNGPSMDELLDTFNQTLDDIFEKVSWDAEIEQGKHTSDNLLQRDELADLGEKVQVLVDHGLICRLKPSDVVRLLDVLASHIGLAEGVCIQEDESEKSERAQIIIKALDAMTISLRIMGAADMPKEIYREESIDKLVDLVKHHMIHNVFVFVDASYYQIHRGLQTAPESPENDNQKSSAQSSLQRKSFAVSQKRKGSSLAGKKHQVPKIVGIVSDLLSRILGQLAHLLFVVHLPDATILQLTNLGISALPVVGIDLIQTKAVDVVVSAFKQYPEHRSLVLDSLLVILLKLPAAGRHLRRYMLPHDDAKSIQVISALLMKSIQSSVTFDCGYIQGAKGDALAVVTRDTDVSGYADAFRWSHYFWKELLKGWHSAKLQEIDIKGLMQNLLTDLLTTLNLPEWPIASLMLLSLSAQLLSSYGINSSEIKVRELALDFIGQVAARIKEDTLACENDTLWLEVFQHDGKGLDEPHASNLILAVETANQDAAEARSNVEASGLQMTETRGVDMLVLEAMLLRYVHCAAMRHRTVVQSEPQPLSFFLAMLSREAERRGVGFRSGFSGPGGDRAIYKQLSEILNNHTDCSTNDSLNDVVLLPRSLAIRLSRKLQQQQPLARQLHILVERLLGALEDSAITVRAAAVRAVAGVVDADPGILSWDVVQVAVERRMSDHGTMVRSAIMDLLGKHVVEDPSIADKYYPSIVERISDVGVSVRKRVINILYDCLRASPDFRHRIEALRSLAFRILDDDLGIQELVVRIFRELWFSRLPLQRETAENSINPIAERAEQLVEVLWEVYTGVSRTGLAKLPLLPTFPIVAILRQVVFSNDDENLHPVSTTVEHRSGFEANENVSMARRLCRAILDGMLEKEECEIDNCYPLATAENHTGERNNGFGPSSFPRAVRYALGLHVFCATDPQLCVMDENPLAFATALQPYIKRHENTASNAMQLQCCISVLDAVVKEVGCLSLASAIEMEKDLRFLLLRNTFHGVLYYAVRCICSIAETLNDSTIASGALQISRRFVKLLGELCEKEVLSAGDRAHVSRSLFVLGHLARFGADTLEASAEEAVSPANLLRLFRHFLQRSSTLEFDLKRGALQACGFLFVSRPHLMLDSKGGFGKGSMDGIMRAALSSSAERNLKEQALMNLDEYLREEEIRTLLQMSDDSSALVSATNQGMTRTSASMVGTGGAISRARRRRHADAKRATSSENGTRQGQSFQTVNGENDNSLTNGVAQRYWYAVLELCADHEPTVRLKALHLAEVVLRQGLVHPMSCFPPLIALQADPVPTVRKLAMRLLRRQQNKYPDFFEHQLSAGLELLFEFCKRLQSAARRATKERQRGALNDFELIEVASNEDVNRSFCNIYKLVNGTRATRFKFLRALLRRYEGKTSGSDITYLCFLASAISGLPFTMSDEVLFVVFHVNRIISLRASMLQESLQRRLKRLEETNADNVDAETREGVELSIGVSILLALKHNLKLAYDLNDSRMQAYNPAEALKTGEGFRFDKDSAKIDLSWVDPLSAATLAGCKQQYELFCSLMHDDSNDYANDLHGEGRKRVSGRSVKATTAGEESDDEYIDGNQNTTGSVIPGSGRKRKRRQSSSA